VRFERGTPQVRSAALFPAERSSAVFEAPGQIVAWPAVEPHSFAVLAGDDPEAVMLDLVQP
jgi:hypothetical protein